MCVLGASACTVTWSPAPGASSPGASSPAHPRPCRRPCLSTHRSRGLQSQRLRATGAVIHGCLSKVHSQGEGTPGLQAPPLSADRPRATVGAGVLCLPRRTPDGALTGGLCLPRTPDSALTPRNLRPQGPGAPAPASVGY